jgi:hypothetical protein
LPVKRRVLWLDGRRWILSKYHFDPCLNHQ